MTVTIALNSDCLNRLDLTPAQSVIEKWLQTGVITDQEQQLRFEFADPRDPDDPRELSEIPEVRLWFVRLDARYPWLPYLLDWEAGELARYTAMLVPHQFSKTDGIQYNPEALELFVMNKVFVVMDWLRQQGVNRRTKIKFMTQILGYELEDAFFELVEST
ncbi:CRR6 family NdhI maturation factor [Oscillatoria sp. FACHB-1407]|uniref:CRR6 family NdhI maturation factor n=1 Tax=Oscillatoria sp. FACHB-1407 TaxID=2692847 RepID=UPI00168813F6|nr:CRR6 family NdhI maturation factor [Oscillatoria sp. FACHB-1407]MBD2460818.1 CRR6 family NdhI maturation factor [Oscillatoria sp. FACHB-1407]